MAPLSFMSWLGKNWKISGSTGVTDVDTGDVVTFTTAMAGGIKLNAITCNHGAAHDAGEWRNRDCIPPALDMTKVAGMTSSGRNFEIVSSEVEVEPGKMRNRLTCSVINPTTGGGLESMALVNIAEGLAGGACWTAEDG